MSPLMAVATDSGLEDQYMGRASDWLNPRNALPRGKFHQPASPLRETRVCEYGAEMKNPPWRRVAGANQHYARISSTVAGSLSNRVVHRGRSQPCLYSLGEQGQPGQPIIISLTDVQA